MLSWIKNIMIDYIRTRWPLFLFVFIFFCTGLGFGAIAVQSLDANTVRTLSVGVNQFLEKPNIATNFEKPEIKASIVSSVRTIFAISVLGITVVGIPLILLAVFANGFIIGFTVSFLLQEKALKGIAFALLTLLPPNFFNVPLLILASVIAISFSWVTVKNRFLTGRIPMASRLGGYCLMMATLCILSAVVGTMRTAITPDVIQTTVNIIK